MKHVSIIIPTFNRATLIDRAINSCLTSSKLELEIIVVDDGSTDGTPDIVNAFGAPVSLTVLENNGGAQLARNTGIDIATGSYIKFLDSDDYLEPGSLEEEYLLAEKDQADIVVSGWASRMLDGSTHLNLAPVFAKADALIDDVLQGRGVHTGAALYRTSYLKDHEIRWNSKIQKLDDWCFFAEATLALGKVSRREGVAYTIVQHDGPRLTDASMLENALDHHRVLSILESNIESQGALTETRRKRLAEYHFKELQVLARYDKEGFNRALSTINRLSSNVDPRQAIASPALGWLAKLIGVRPALQIYAFLRR